MSMYFMKKLAVALCNLPKSFKYTPSPTLIMTLLVKNEEDILEQNLIFHKSMGVDGFIVTDNNSSDGTQAIIQKYIQKGWIKKCILQTDTNYEQKKWVDHMVWMAKTEFHADWIINADADELWYSPSQNLKNELSHTQKNVLRCKMHNIYPEEDKPIWYWNRIINSVADYEKYDLSTYSIFERQNCKVIHRAAGYLQISMGNHKVTMFPQKSLDSDISIYHYCIRGKQHFLTKMINGGKQLEQHKGRHGGRHWRYFYSLHKQGLLEQEYERVIGNNVFDQLVKEGYIVEDNTIGRYYDEHLKNKKI